MGQIPLLGECRYSHCDFLQRAGDLLGPLPIAANGSAQNYEGEIFSGRAGVLVPELVRDSLEHHWVGHAVVEWR